MVLRSFQVAKVNSQVKLLRVNVARSKHVAVKNSCREAVEVYLLDAEFEKFQMYNNRSLLASR
jgi:hypothetical protein